MDCFGGGLLAFVLACASYRYVELPIRRWRKAAGAMQRPGRIFACGIAAGTSAALIGGLTGFGGYLWISSYVTSAYGINGKGAFDNGCRLITASTIPPPCLDGNVGILLGDSHANSMFGSLARSFHEAGVQLIYVGRGGCDPLHFAISERQNDRQHGCANLLGPFEQLLVRDPPITSVIVTPAWIGLSRNTQLWSELLSQFDPAKTRILVMAPAPPSSTLACVVLSDRYSANRDRCVRERSVVDKERAPIVQALKAAVDRFPNVRYIDPIELFCDSKLCKPFLGNRVLFSDATHLQTSGMDMIQDRFEADFRWVEWQK
jgi:hypothetical protein